MSRYGRPALRGEFCFWLSRLAASRKWSRARGLFRAPGPCDQNRPVKPLWGVGRPSGSGAQAIGSSCGPVSANRSSPSQKPITQPSPSSGRQQQQRLGHFRRGVDRVSGRREGGALHHDAVPCRIQSTKSTRRRRVRRLRSMICGTIRAGRRRPRTMSCGTGSDPCESVCGPLQTGTGPVLRRCPGVGWAVAVVSLTRAFGARRGRAGGRLPPHRSVRRACRKLLG